LGYQVWYDQGLGEDFILLASDLTEREYTAVGLYSATIYSFMVKARNSVGYSILSNPVSILAA
jgi:hypothetical protein